MAHPQHHERMARIDGCPACVANYEAPQRVADDGTGTGFVATYTCTDCRHQWQTTWGDERPGSAA